MSDPVDHCIQCSTKEACSTLGRCVARRSMHLSIPPSTYLAKSFDPSDAYRRAVALSQGGKS